MKFEAVPGVFDRQVWKWRQSGGEAMVEFLTPAFGEEGIKPCRTSTTLSARDNHLGRFSGR
jgi:hypothetical protein